MKSILITGANKGIGFEATRLLLREGHYVYLGSRDLEKGQQAVQKLKSEGLGSVEAIQLDVTNDDSVKKACADIGKKTDILDILINNAGISGLKFDAQGNFIPQTKNAIEASIVTFKEVNETNLYGVVRVTQAFLAMLKKSTEPRIVNVSSSVGSLALQSDPNWIAYDFGKYAIYGSSKAALNMYTVHLAYELKGTKFKVNAVDPGYSKTDFTNYQGTSTAEDAAARVIKFALIDENGPSGKFFSEETNPVSGQIPW